MFRSAPTFAAQITTRSLTLVAGTSDGGSKIGGVVNHSFTFTVPTSTAIGSIQFQYCTTASIAACVTPTGLVTTSATIGSQAGVAGWTSLVTTTNGAPYLTRGSTITPGAGTSATIQLNTITNPTTVGGVTFFVRISTFLAFNATGTAIDTGSVAASTANQIVLNGTMPESLTFCAGATIGTTGGVPDCTTATTATVLFNQLFSPTDTATATSQFAASTNAGGGYSVTVNGATLTSGSNTITAMATAGLGVRGTSQFGMNLKLNTTLTSTVAVGAEITAASNGTSLRGQAIPASGYDVVDNFKYVSGNAIANSGNTVLGPTNAQIYTASYIVNVPGNQPPGLYAATLTYICTATY
jgi:hypothetical protein